MSEEENRAIRASKLPGQQANPIHDPITTSNNQTEAVADSAPNHTRAPSTDDHQAYIYHDTGETNMHGHNSVLPRIDIFEHYSHMSDLTKSTRKSKTPIPENNKDERYWEKRKRNNEAARKSRENKRKTDASIRDKLAIAEAENAMLRKELAMLKSQFGLPHDQSYRYATSKDLHNDAHYTDADNPHSHAVPIHPSPENNSEISQHPGSSHRNPCSQEVPLKKRHRAKTPQEHYNTIYSTQADVASYNHQMWAMHNGSPAHWSTSPPCDHQEHHQDDHRAQPVPSSYAMHYYITPDGSASVGYPADLTVKQEVMKKSASVSNTNSHNSSTNTNGSQGTGAVSHVDRKMAGVHMQSDLRSRLQELSHEVNEMKSYFMKE